MLNIGADPPRMTICYVTHPPLPPTPGVPSQYYVTINFPLLVLPSNNRAIYTRRNNTRLTLDQIRRELYHLYEYVLCTTRTARINGSRLISLPVATAIQRGAPKINACVLCVRVLFKTRRSFIRSFSRLS